MTPDRTPVAASAPRDWRKDIAGASAIVALIGAWLIVSPFVLNYGSGDARWSPIACGVLAIVVVAAQSVRRAWSPTPGMILMAIGVWLFASGFWLADSSPASWNAFGAGALMFFLGSVSVTATPRRHGG